MSISIITAMTKERIIGVSNGLPWKIKQELLYFKEKTLNKIIIMGSNTFLSIGCQPLKNRYNIILTSNINKFKNKEYNNLYLVTNLKNSLLQAEQIINLYNADTEIMIIGGREIYKQFLPLADKLYISTIKHNYSGDIYFPDFDLNNWHLTNSQDYEEFIANTYVGHR